jgi:hypothetical protein
VSAVLDIAAGSAQITTLTVADFLKGEFLLCLLSVCHLVVLLNNVDERGQPWRSALSVSASFDSSEVNFINILFCVCVCVCVCPLFPLIMYPKYF